MLLDTSSNNTLIITPEMPDGWRGDMEWDLSDILFMLEMEGVEVIYGDVYGADFHFCGETYALYNYDAHDLSVGISVELYAWV